MKRFTYSQKTGFVEVKNHLQLEYTQFLRVKSKVSLIIAIVLATATIYYPIIDQFINAIYYGWDTGEYILFIGFMSTLYTSIYLLNWGYFSNAPIHSFQESMKIGWALTYLSFLISSFVLFVIPMIFYGAPAQLALYFVVAVFGLLPCTAIAIVFGIIHYLTMRIITKKSSINKNLRSYEKSCSNRSF